MFVCKLQAEDVSRQIKPADLTTAVIENFVCPHGAAYHLVDVICRLVLAKNLEVARVRHLRAHKLHGLSERVMFTRLGIIARSRLLRCRQSADRADAAAVCRLSEHEPFLREFRRVLVMLGSKARNSDNRPKGYPGRSRRQRVEKRA